MIGCTARTFVASLLSTSFGRRDGFGRRRKKLVLKKIEGFIKGGFTCLLSLADGPGPALRRDFSTSIAYKLLLFDKHRNKCYFEGILKTENYRGS